jgi:hypothetical protein
MSPVTFAITVPTAVEIVPFSNVGLTDGLTYFIGNCSTCLWR